MYDRAAVNSLRPQESQLKLGFLEVQDKLEVVFDNTAQFEAAELLFNEMQRKNDDEATGANANSWKLRDLTTEVRLRNARVAEMDQALNAYLNHAAEAQGLEQDPVDIAELSDSIKISEVVALADMGLIESAIGVKSKNLLKITEIQEQVTAVIEELEKANPDPHMQANFDVWKKDQEKIEENNQKQIKATEALSDSVELAKKIKISQAVSSTESQEVTVQKEVSERQTQVSEYLKSLVDARISYASEEALPSYTDYMGFETFEKD